MYKTYFMTILKFDEKLIVLLTSAVKIFALFF